MYSMIRLESFCEQFLYITRDIDVAGLKILFRAFFTAYNVERKNV